MTHEEIIAIAKEAGGYESPQYPENLVMDAHDLARFAALVEAKEREACAQVCESTVWTASIPEWRDMTKHDIAVKSMLACAAAIRARARLESK